MSSDRQSESPSETPSELSLATEARLRGAPLLDALEKHESGSRERGEAMGSYAFATGVALGLGRAGAELCRETAKLCEIGLMYESDDPYLDGASLTLGAGVPSDVCDWILQTRERYDGSGPQELEGTEIAIAARIARAAASCARSLTKTAPGHADRLAAAVTALRAGAGSEFDPEVVKALAGVLESTRT